MEDVPPQAIDLIGKLLCYVPGERITAEQCLKHEFFADVTPESKITSKATSASTPNPPKKRTRSQVNLDSSTPKAPSKRVKKTDQQKK